MINQESTPFSPTLTVLSDTDRQTIIQAARRVLAQTGMTLQHNGAATMLKHAGSLKMVVIMDEVIDQVRRKQKGIEIDADQLAVEVIGQGAEQGHFLTHPHTLKHLRPTQWRPGLFCRRGYECWAAEGRTSLLERAHTRMNRILADHRPPPVPKPVWAAVERFKADL